MQRKTKQRAAIQAAIENNSHPLSVEELHAIAAKEVENLGIATVYRALKALCEEGIIQRIEIPGEQPRYEAGHLHHHHHAYCNRCDKVFEAEGCFSKIDSLAPNGFAVERHEITFYGVCATCSKN